MSDRNSTDSGDLIPSTPSKPRDSNDNRVDLPEDKKSTIQESKDESIVLQGKDSEPEERQVKLQDQTSTTVMDVQKEDKNSDVIPEDSGRDRLKRHRKEVAGRVWIPETWGKEELLKDWMDCSAFNASLVPSGIVSARAALIEEGRRAKSGGLTIENRCRVSL